MPSEYRDSWLSNAFVFWPLDWIVLVFSSFLPHQLIHRLRKHLLQLFGQLDAPSQPAHDGSPHTTETLKDLLSQPAEIAREYASDTPPPREAYRLCIFCRNVEPTSKPCPKLETGSTKSVLDLPPKMKEDVPLSAADETLLTWLQTQPSALCTRCRSYDPIKVFKFAEPPDTYEFTRDDGSLEAYTQDMRLHALELGELRHLTLSASCQFCRLIYRILPSTPLPPTYKGVSIIPFRAHHRFPNWEQFPLQTRTRSAILLGLSFAGTVEDIITRRHYSSSNAGHFGNTVGPAIALAVEDPAVKRKRVKGIRALATSRSKYNGRLVEPLIDFESAKEQLDFCMKHHQACNTTIPDELHNIKLIDVSMIDVSMMDLLKKPPTIVPYPRGCHYAALSYSWGRTGVDEQARTIDDGIIATKKLGLRYLWIDRYCVDQQDREDKVRQFAIMDLIYQCADVTLIALAGDDSNAGLRGVSQPREIQLKETINDLTLFTLPPQADFERQFSKWNTRAWTMQEGMLSRRKIYFSSRQVGFSCQLFSSSDAHDSDCFFPSSIGHPSDSFYASINSFRHLHEQADVMEIRRAFLYMDVVTNYTQREMSYASDSLHACQGMLSALQRRMFPLGFEWGLPLRDFPITLGWTHVPDDWHNGKALYHEHQAPGRRHDFPSWSWCGWEGNVQFSGLSLLISHGPRKRDILSDLELQFVSVQDKTLTVNAWLVDLEVRTDAFSQAFAYDSAQHAKGPPLGMVRDRARPSVQNAVPSGKYSCLVIERQKERKGRNAHYSAQTVHLIVLDWEGEVATRRTSITLFADAGFMVAQPRQRLVRLQ